MPRRLLEQIILGADRGLGRGHQLLANRIDRRIRHLREQLLEVVVERLRFVREHRERSVSAHRADRLLPVRRHRREDHFEILDRVAERLLLLEQLVGLEVVNRRRAARFRKRLECDETAVEPFAIRLPRRHRLLDLFVLHDSAERGVDEKHSARLQAPLVRDVLRRDVEHARLRRHHHQPVLGHRVARRTQAVAIEHRADPDSVGERDRRGAVPRLHHARMKIVERALAVAHLPIVLPRFRNHHHHGVRDRTAGANQQLETVVEGRGVAAVGLDDRQQLLDVVAEQRRRKKFLARDHPVDIAAQRVDLAVVRHEAVRMRAVPAREGVGREALMHHRERGLERVVQ